MTMVEHLLDFPPEIGPRGGAAEEANLVIDSASASGNKG
jgi:hypothetical protein